jgi:transcriptional regulator with XRE-family HTH domain
MVKDQPSTDMFRNLGPALGLLRELRGLSQAEVARRAGVGKSRISKYEKSRESPKLASLQRMLEVLGVRHDAFFSVVAFLDRLPEALSALPGAPVPPFAMVPSTSSSSLLTRPSPTASRLFFRSIARRSRYFSTDSPATLRSTQVQPTRSHEGVPPAPPGSGYTVHLLGEKRLRGLPYYPSRALPPQASAEDAGLTAGR